MRTALLFVAAALLGGCAAVHSQLVTIEPITAPHPKESAAAALPGFGAAASKDAVLCVEKVPDHGNWFVRRVLQPDGESRKLYAVEIIYCPTEKSVFGECRVAVTWARDGKGGLGPQAGAPPSSAKDDVEETAAEAAPATTPSPAPAAAAAPTAAPSSQASSPAPASPAPSPAAAAPAPGPNDPVALKGRKYSEIPAGDLVRLRNWIWKPVSLSLKKGKATSGQLRSYDSSGVQLDNPTDADSYGWSEIESISPSTARPPPEAPAAKPSEAAAPAPAPKEPAKQDGPRRPVGPTTH